MSHKKGKGKKKESDIKRGSDENPSTIDKLVESAGDPALKQALLNLKTVSAKAKESIASFHLSGKMEAQENVRAIASSAPGSREASHKKNKGKKKDNADKKRIHENPSNFEEYVESEDDPVVKQALIDFAHGVKFPESVAVPAPHPVHRDRTDMTRMLAKMAELDLAKDTDDLSKSFLSECKQKADALVLSEEEKSHTLDEIRSIMDSYPSLSAPESQEHIRDLFVLKVNINSDMRRSFMEDFGQWKDLLRDRKQVIQDQCRLESDIANLTNVTSQLRSVYEDVMKKSTEVTLSTSSLIAVERQRNFEMKSGFSETLEGVEKRYKEHEEDTKRRLSDIQELKDKLEEIKQHFEMQKKYFKDQLQVRSQLPQIYQAKLQQKKNIEAKQKKELDQHTSVMKAYLLSIEEMKNYMTLFQEKRLEVEQQVKHTNEMLEYHQKERDEFTAMEKRVDEETDALKAEMKELEATILRNTDTIRKHEVLYHNLHKESRAKLNECRILQEKRSRAQTSASVSEAPSSSAVAEHIPPIPSSSSSSSSSSARPLRELITPTAGEESPAYSSPPGSQSF
jgi:hypothetical protein